MVYENNIPVEIPKTETVYELKESDYEIKTSKLSAAARSKVIKRYGSDYLSERAFTDDIALSQMYGPGFWENLVKGTSATLLAASYFTPAAIVTIPATAAVATWGAAVQAGGGDPKYGDAGEFVTDIAAGAAVGAVGIAVAPAVGGSAGKTIVKCSTHCPK